MVRKTTSLIDKDILFCSIKDSFIKLHPRTMIKNPVMFVTMIGAIMTTISMVHGSFGGHSSSFEVQITIWLWFTVLFANFAEAIAEGRGKAQAASLKKGKKDLHARILVNDKEQSVPASQLRIGDLVICQANDLIPADGEVIKGIASVDESAITGESAPVIRESGGDRSAVTGGTKVISDELINSHHGRSRQYIS